MPAASGDYILTYLPHILPHHLLHNSAHGYGIQTSTRLPALVCVETLKRDWTSTLKLRDVLVTISCLLIQPNPASALNEAAGKLATEDWDGYCRRAKLMTEIHAAVPSNIASEVKEAQMRGEDNEEGSPQPVPKAQVKGKGKMRAKATPSTSKVQTFDNRR